MFGSECLADRRPRTATAVPEVGARGRLYRRHLICYSITVQADAAETGGLRAATAIVLFSPYIYSPLSFAGTAHLLQYRLQIPKSVFKS